MCTRVHPAESLDAVEKLVTSGTASPHA
jgi:hypothetical protein